MFDARRAHGFRRPRSKRWGGVGALPRAPLTCVMASVFFPMSVRASPSTRELQGGVAILPGCRTRLPLAPCLTHESLSPPLRPAGVALVTRLS